MIHATVHLVTGFLGAGKTTLLKHLLSQRPANEKWALIVNEFGEIGIDGAALSGDEVPVKEIAGGCLCCVAGPQLTATVATLLRQHKPDRLFIEASGLAHAAGLVDELRTPPLSNALTIGVVLTVLDPRQFIDSDYARQPLYRDQIGVADVLIANKISDCDADTLAQYRQKAAALFPAKRALLEVDRGELDPAVLGLTPLDKGRYRPHTAPGDNPDYFSQGWTLPPEQAFDAERLTRLFDQLPALVPGLERAKGVFCVAGSWVWLNWAAGQWGASEVAWRRDNRFEVIARSPLAADSIEAALLAAREV